MLVGKIYGVPFNHKCDIGQEIEKSFTLPLNLICLRLLPFYLNLNQVAFPGESKEMEEITYPIYWRIKHYPISPYLILAEMYTWAGVGVLTRSQKCKKIIFLEWRMEHTFEYISLDFSKFIIGPS